MSHNPLSVLPRTRKNSEDTEYLLSKALKNVNFFDEHPCKLRDVMGKEKCEDGECPFALSMYYCAIFAMRARVLENCKKIENEVEKC